mmetsp:Transcript_88469/g.245709  ORF Transcript_88469/g.245709 Transcript_88469/m.245709 type:complete len:220 (+) Transcript_88469:1322-1981(+)
MLRRELGQGLLDGGMDVLALAGALEGAPDDGPELGLGHAPGVQGYGVADQARLCREIPLSKLWRRGLPAACAMAARREGVRLPEEPADLQPEALAGPRGGEAPHGVEGLRAQLLLRLREVLRVKVAKVLVEVPIAVQEHTPGGKSVTPRTTDLLIVLLEALRRAVVHHPAQVRLVDTHAEGDGRHDHGEGSAEEAPVRLLPLSHGHLRMVDPNLHASRV